MAKEETTNLRMQRIYTQDNLTVPVWITYFPMKEDDRYVQVSAEIEIKHKGKITNLKLDIEGLSEEQCDNKIQKAVFRAVN